MTLDDWLARVRAELALDDLTWDAGMRHTVLDLARDAAHQVQRPAAPLTTFLVGVAVGRGEQSLDSAAARVTALALALDDQAPPPEQTPIPAPDDARHHLAAREQSANRPNDPSVGDVTPDR